MLVVGSIKECNTVSVFWFLYADLFVKKACKHYTELVYKHMFFDSYAYSEGPNDFDEEETIALTSMGASPPIDAEASRERGPVKTDVFRLEEEIGEEKIE